jgi:hypothetical protein
MDDTGLEDISQSPGRQMKAIFGRFPKERGQKPFFIDSQNSGIFLVF